MAITSDPPEVVSSAVHRFLLRRLEKDVAALKHHQARLEMDRTQVALYQPLRYRISILADPLVAETQKNVSIEFEGDLKEGLKAAEMAFRSHNKLDRVRASWLVSVLLTHQSGDIPLPREYWAPHLDSLGIHSKEL